LENFKIKSVAFVFTKVKIKINKQKLKKLAKKIYLIVFLTT
jgi:hypothetical protein